MSLGLCCQYVVKEIAPRSGKVSYRNIMDDRVLQLGRFKDNKYTFDQIRGTYIHNTKSLYLGLERIIKAGYKVFRVSSSLFPLWDLVPEHAWNNEEVIGWLKKTGDLALRNGIRLTTHPGQFCSISSESEIVLHKSLMELKHHAWVFDSMGLPISPHAAINIHGAKANRTAELISVINDLPDNIRKRLTLENDESSYSAVDLLPIAQATSVPVVFDSHHHTFNTGELTMEEAVAATLATWPVGIKPLQHISNTSPDLVNGSFSDRRKHSDMIHYIPEPQLQLIRNNDVDVDVEAKLKNISIEKMLQDFSLSL